MLTRMNKNNSRYTGRKVAPKNFAVSLAEIRELYEEVFATQMPGDVTYDVLGQQIAEKLGGLDKMFFLLKKHRNA